MWHQSFDVRLLECVLFPRVLFESSLYCRSALDSHQRCSSIFNSRTSAATSDAEKLFTLNVSGPLSVPFGVHACTTYISLLTTSFRTRPFFLWMTSSSRASTSTSELRLAERGTGAALPSSLASTVAAMIKTRTGQPAAVCPGVGTCRISPARRCFSWSRTMETRSR